MLKNITLGQFYPADSPVHRLDARTKLGATLLYIISLFVSDSFAALGLAAAALIAAVALARISPGYMLRGTRGILLLVLLSIVCNLFLTDGEVICSFWIFHITREGLIQALRMAARMLLLVLGTSLMTFTTTPTALTDGMEHGLRFLTVIKVPVHEIAMMMSIALRFIPILAEEADKIEKAQMARGADFESGNAFRRAKALVPVLVPLFVSAFRRAGDLAMAMEARCYRGSEGRTRMKPLHYGRRDLIAACAVLLYFAGMIVL